MAFEMMTFHNEDGTPNVPATLFIYYQMLWIDELAQVLSDYTSGGFARDVPAMLKSLRLTLENPQLSELWVEDYGDNQKASETLIAWTDMLITSYLNYSNRS